MKKGRPVKGPNLIDKLDGDDFAKKRAKIILSTINGELSIEEACKEIGIKRTRFFELRNEFLSGGLKQLEPQLPGRPKSNVLTEDQLEIEKLNNEIKMLKVYNKLHVLREAVALVMPEQTETHKAILKKKELKKKKLKKLNKQSKKRNRK